MNSARYHFERHGIVVETGGHKSWDYEVGIDGVLWHVEVKGTTGDPVDVILTPNEVSHALSYEHVALYVVSNIDVVAVNQDQCAASGGRVTIFHPWKLSEEDLRPLGYKYCLPDVAASLAPVLRSQSSTAGDTIRDDSEV